MPSIISRTLVHIPDFRKAWDDLANIVDKLESDRTHLLNTYKPIPHSEAWIKRLASQLAHPLAEFVSASESLPEFRGNAHDLELEATLKHAEIIGESIARNDSALFGESLCSIASDLIGREMRFRDATITTTSDSRGICVMFPDHRHIPARLSELISLIRSSSCPIALKAISSQVVLLNLHPFRDGNGRVARVLFNSVFSEFRRAEHLNIPFYHIRNMTPFTFEICVRMIELRGSWKELVTYYSKILESLSAELDNQGRLSTNLL